MHPGRGSGFDKKRFRNFLKHYRLNGVSPRVHKNVKRRPWNAASFADKEKAVSFIKNFAEAHAHEQKCFQAY